MKSIIAVMAIWFVQIASVHAYTPSLTELCEHRYVVNQQHYEEQAHKSTEIFMLLREGKSLPEVIAEIYEDEMLRYSATVQLKDVAMYQAAFMQQHIAEFTKLDDEQIAAWWISRFEDTKAI